jgi:hypothetical protein
MGTIVGETKLIALISENPFDQCQILVFVFVSMDAGERCSSSIIEEVNPIFLSVKIRVIRVISGKVFGLLSLVGAKVNECFLLPRLRALYRQ